MAVSRRRKRQSGATARSADRRGKTAKLAVRGKRTRHIAMMVSVAVVAGGALMAAYWWRTSSAPSVESIPVPDNARAIGHLGRVYHANDFRALAQECYRRAELLDSVTADWPYYFVRLAAAYGLPQQAREAYPRTVAPYPMTPPLTSARPVWT